MKPLSLFIMGLLGGLLFPSIAAASSASVIMYHRFGEAGFPSTNTSIEQLNAHITELTSNNYKVLPLEKIVVKLKSGQALPNRTVGISIDDGYKSIYTTAWPRLKAANLPFTVFLATSHIDRRSSNHLNWDQIREMQKAGVEFGHHTVSHPHITKLNPQRLNHEIDYANQRFKKELGIQPKLFAYPYGEASLSIISTIKKNGFIAAFGQHSGVIGSTGDMFYLPRFSMNEAYGNIGRLRLAVNALPLKVTDITPLDHLIGDKNPPSIGFTVIESVGALDKLSCFLSHAGQSKIIKLGPRIEVRTDKRFEKGRTRLNCTMPTKNNRWRWYGRQFVVH